MDNIADILNFISTSLEATGNYISAYLSSLSGTKMAALILFLIAIVMALSLVVIWYVKSIVMSINYEKSLDREYRSKIDNRLDKKLLSLSDDEEDGFDEEDFVKDKVSPENRSKKISKYAQPLDLDWERGGVSESYVSKPDNFQYQLKPQKLLTLLGLIIDMLERGVDEPKMAQTVMYKNQHLNTEDEIIQTITAIKFFIYFCISGKFEYLESKKFLPQEDAALFHLANGDISLALILMEALLDKKIDEFKSLVEDKEREKAFCEASNCATIFGSLSALLDFDLAAKAFEMAIELNPRNSTAWGRLGDMYNHLFEVEKAVWAYSNVLNIADFGISTQQTANANKMLASYYIENGYKYKAEEMLELSQAFYDSIGINNSLSEKELGAVDIIESKRFENMEAIIEKLFKSKNLRQMTITS